MFQTALPKAKLKPPHAGCTSFVYTLTSWPGANQNEENSKLGRPSATSRRVQPSRSTAAEPPLRIRTYSPGSCLPSASKRIHSITTTADTAGKDVGVAVGTGVDVGVAISTGVDTGVAVDTAIAVGVTVGTGVLVAAEAVADVGAAAGTAVGSGGGPAIGEAVGTELGVGTGVAEGTAVEVGLT